MGRLEEDEMAEGPYSRVYWSLIDDHPDIYDADGTRATYVRLLVTADQAWPASAYFPRGLRARAVQLLVDAGLVTRGRSGRYSVKGLDEERQKRQEHARTAAGARWDAMSNARSNAASNAQPMPSREEKSKEEKSQGEQTREQPGNDPWRDDEGEALSWLAKHGCDVRPGNGYHRQLVTAVGRHGVNAVVGMFDRLYGAGVKVGDTKGFLLGAIDALDSQSRPKLAELEKDDRDDERERVHRQSLARTQAYIESMK